MPSIEEQLELRERSRTMFYHAYDSYMLHAFPEVSCWSKYVGGIIACTVYRSLLFCYVC